MLANFTKTAYGMERYPNELPCSSRAFQPLRYAAIALLASSLVACNSSTVKQTEINHASRATQPSNNTEPIQTRSPTPSPAAPSRSPGITFFQGAYPPKPLTLVDAVEPGSDFFKFRERLRQAVRDRDADYIRSIASSPIKLGFGVGPTEIDALKIDHPDAPFWKQLEKAIATGCADSNQLYNNSSSKTESWVCPHVFAASATIDRQEFPGEAFAWEVFIIGQDVPIRAEARSDAALIGTLSQERALLDGERIARFKQPSANTTTQEPEWYSTEGWTPILMPTGQRGYVENRYLYDVLGYRAFFSNQNGKWQLDAFVAGD